MTLVLTHRPGGASAIEDAAVLGECLSWAYKNQRGVSAATEAYEKLRKPRVERLQDISRGNYGFLSADDEAARARDKALGLLMAAQDEHLLLSEEERVSGPKAAPDQSQPYPSPGLSQWMYAYDSIQTTREYLASLA